MKIYESAVRKPVSTVLMFVGVMVFGLFSLMNLAVDQYPEIEIPQISVITFYPGANAADIETNITRILEDNLNTVSNLKKLTSKSQDNVSMIIVEFEYGSDLTEGANEIRDVVSRSQSQLPDDIDYPTIFKFSTSMIPVIMLAVTADESYPALKKILDDKFVNVLNRVDGVGAVTVMGAPEREVQVNVDPAKLEAYNLTVEQLGQIIAAENVNIPSGTIDIGNNTFNIKADGEFKLSDEMRKVVVSNAGGRTVMLSDVAEIRDTLEKATMDERANGQRSVRVMIQKQSGANTVDIVHEIQKRLPDIQASLPRDVKMETIFEGSQEITNAIGSLSETIMYAFIFVVLEFTRIGASDDLASGQSTFMVEMTEVADILKNATPRSLLILDEIGRGTSTFDGMAIARAVLEYAADRKRLGAKTLFATHYHELTDIEQALPGVKNFNIAVKKRQGDMIFLRKIVPGAADDSYGIEVAKLAGIPDRVITRAREILKDLESGAPERAKPAAAPVSDQVSMLDMQSDELRRALEAITVETLTPIEALNQLYQLKQLL